MGRRRGDLEPVSSIVERLSKRYGFEKMLHLRRIRRAWVELFGEFSKHVMPEDYRRKTVYLHTESPVWKTELTYLRDRIKKALSSRLDIPIKKVVIKIAPYRSWKEDGVG